jgi:hypothetical protein
MQSIETGATHTNKGIGAPSLIYPIKRGIYALKYAAYMQSIEDAFMALP